MAGQEQELGMPARSTRPGWQAVLSLAAFAALAGLGVGLAWDSTRERIADNEARRVLAELAATLPPALLDDQTHRASLLLGTPGAPLGRA